MGFKVNCMILKNNVITFEELVNWYLLEGISKEQKEKGQREMVKEELNPFVRLRQYLLKKWKGKNTMEDINKKRDEFFRLNYLYEMGKEMMKSSDKKTGDYIHNVVGSKPNWLTLSSKEVFNDAEKNGVVGGGEEPAILGIGVPKFKGKIEKSNGFKFDISEKEMRKKLRRFIILHEYGHLYDWMKQMVENNYGKIISTFDKDVDKVTDSEGKANAYALDNMYRKDRRELLKNSGVKISDFDDAEKRLKGGHTKFDEYLAGTKRHSKTLEKTLKGIEKEKSHFNY